MDRSERRSELRAARRKPERPSGRWGPDQARAAHLRGLAATLRARCVAAYVALPGEPDPAAAVQAWRAAGVVVLLPVLGPGAELCFVRDDGQYRTGRHGLTEPVGAPDPRGLAGADLVVVPALAVDAIGTRLGQGGGSYDRALPRRRAGVPAVALLREPELLRAPLRREDWDAPVDAVVTPRGLWWLAPR